MSSISHATFAVGDRYPAAVIEEVRAAARALKPLPPEATPVSNVELTEATADVFNDYSLVSDRVAAMAEVDPDATVDLLCELVGEIGDDGHDKVNRRYFEEALRDVSEVDTGVVAEALPELNRLFRDPADVTRSLPLALARTAVDYPGAVATYADEIGVFLGNPERLVRERAATALVAIGRENPDALASPSNTLLDRADEAVAVEDLGESRSDLPATAPEWPLGVVAAADPSFAVEAVEAVVPDRHTRGDRADLICELAAGDPGAAVDVYELLLEHGELPRRNSKPTVTVAEEHPAVVVAAAERIVAALTEYDDEADREVRLGIHPRSDARPLEAGIAVVAESDPGAVQAAVEAEYGSVEAFVEPFPTEDRERIVAEIDGE